MTKKRILIVDDDQKVSGLVRIFLERAGGYEVLEEHRSYAALATARSFRPNLVLLDVDMPGKDGGEVAAELRLDSTFAKTPILFLTSLVSATENGSHNGKRYLAKSSKPQALLDAVQRLLHDAPGAQVAQRCATA